MAEKALTVSVSVYGVRETIAAFDRLPRVARKEIADANYEIAASFVPRLTFAAARLGRQGSLLGPTVTAVRDRRVPVISAGGSQAVGRRRKPAYKLLFGFEFGSDRYGQFRRHLGGGGSWRAVAALGGSGPCPFLFLGLGAGVEEVFPLLGVYQGGGFSSQWMDASKTRVFP